MGERLRSSRRPGNSVEFFIDGADALPADHERDRLRATLRPPRRLVLLARLPGRRRPIASRAARRRGRARRRSASSAGPAPRCPSSTPTARTCAKRSSSSPAARASATGLDARGRPMHCTTRSSSSSTTKIAFVSGIDLTYLGGDRSRRQPPPAERCDRLARRERPNHRPGSRRRRRALRAALARGHRGEAPRRRPACGKTARTPFRSSEPCPRNLRRATNAATSASWTRTSRAAPARSGSSTWRASSSGRRRSSRSLIDKARAAAARRVPRARRPSRASEERAGGHARATLRPRRRRRGARPFLACTLYQRARTRSARLRPRRRSSSSTTAGSRSAPPT